MQPRERPKLSAGTMLHVQVVTPEGQPQLHTFNKVEVVIGRRPDSDLPLGGKDVSGAHACLQVEGERVMLFDLQSTNGTFVNGHRIAVSTQLGPDDKVTIAEFILRAHLAPTPPDRAPAPPTLPPSPPAPDLNNLEHAAPLVRAPAPAHAPAAGIDTGDLPPIVARPPSRPSRPTPPPPSTAPAPPATPTSAPYVRPPEPPAAALSELARTWHDPTVRRIFILGLERIEIERDGVRLPLVTRTFSTPDDLFAQLSALCGHPVYGTTRERVLADGTTIQCTQTSQFGLYLVITRPRLRRMLGLEALVEDQVLTVAAAELLSACTRARLPVLLAALPGAATAPMISALLGAVADPSAFVRGLPAPVIAPPSCTTFDASHGEGHMASAIRLALAGDVQWLGVDEPELSALDECAWAAASGRGMVVGLRAESLTHALRRGQAIGAGADGPAISYALAAIIGPSLDGRDISAGRSSLRWLGELLPGDGPNSVHELFTTQRHGTLIATAVPQVLTDLAQRGFHLAPELFTLA